MKFVGYITSDPVINGFVPHNIQNMMIKNFLSKQGHDFLLSWTEYKNQSQLAFNSFSDESYFEGICFYSWDQLSGFRNVHEKLQGMLDRKIRLAFAREGFIIHSSSELEQFMENYSLSRFIFQSGDLGQWLNERKKYL